MTGRQTDRQIVAVHCTSTLEQICEDLEELLGCGSSLRCGSESDLLDYYGKPWAKKRLKSVREELKDRAWAEKQWLLGND